MKMYANKVKNAQRKCRPTKSKYSSYKLGKGRRLEVMFGLFRIIFTLPKLKQKELAINSTEILPLN